MISYCYNFHLCTRELYTTMVDRLLKPAMEIWNEDQGLRFIERRVRGHAILTTSPRIEVQSYYS